MHGVLARDRLGRQDDVAIGVAADDRDFTIELVETPRRGSVHDLKCRDDALRSRHVFVSSPRASVESNFLRPGRPCQTFYQIQNSKTRETFSERNRTSAMHSTPSDRAGTPCSTTAVAIPDSINHPSAIPNAFIAQHACLRRSHVIGWLKMPTMHA